MEVVLIIISLIPAIALVVEKVQDLDGLLSGTVRECSIVRETEELSGQHMLSRIPLARPLGNKHESECEEECNAIL